MNELPFSIEQVAYLLQLRIKKRTNNQMYVNCPFCTNKKGQLDNHGHLNINLAKNVFRCNRCNAQGGMLELYSLYYGINHKEAFININNQLNYNKTIYVPPKRKYEIIEKTEERQPLEELNKTYNELLKLLSLSSIHKQNLLNRGLPTEQIESAEYKSTPAVGLKRITSHLIEKGCKVKGVPGFYLDDNGDWTMDIRGNGIMIPVRDDLGNIQGIQIRTDKGDKKYYWLTSVEKKEGTSSDGYMHYANMNLLRNNEVFLTEGPLKADIASILSQRAFIAIPGSSCYKLIESNAEKLKWYGVEVIVNAMDMDRYTNVNVMKNVDSMKKVIEEKGFKLINLKWNERFKGIDDYLLSKKIERQRIQ